MKRTRVEMSKNECLKFDQGYDLFIDYCKARNLREDTIKYYDNTMKTVYKYIDPKLPIKEITLDVVNRFIKECSCKVNGCTIQTYVRGLRTILYYFMKNGYLVKYNIILPKGDIRHAEPYNESEVKLLIKKPKCSNMTFIGYRNYVICNLLLCTGIRLKNLIELKVKDVDLDNGLLYLRTTKNRKPLILPIGESLKIILKEYISKVNPKEYFFTNDFGEKLKRGTLESSLSKYNRSRGVFKTGVHRWRHTFAYRYIKLGGNVVILSKLLGHSSLDVTQRYINILVQDLQMENNKIDMLKEFKKESIKIR